jgi:hypothetical protein
MTDLSPNSPMDRWAGRIPIPHNCPRLVRELFEEMNRQGASLGRVALKAGYSRSAVKRWKNSTMMRATADSRARVACLEDVGHVLGLELCWRRRANGHQAEDTRGCAAAEPVAGDRA